MRYECYDGQTLLSTNRWPYESLDLARFIRLLFIFDLDELKFDIANPAYVMGDVARVNDNYGHDILGDNREHLMHQWKDVCEEGNIERVKRVISLCVGEVENLLFRWTRYGGGAHFSTDNQTRNVAEYVVEMKVPVSFAESTCVYLRDLIHEYIVSSVLEDWASITYPEAQPTWERKKNELRESLRRAGGTTGYVPRVKPSLL